MDVNMSKDHLYKPKSMQTKHSEEKQELPAAPPINLRVLDSVSINEMDSYVFASPQMQEIVRKATRVAKSDIPVFITGETGTGKEVVADLIHLRSERKDKPFIKINCAALPRELIEAELFGSMKGAFTDSKENRVGLFHRANYGTILLDEISEMPIDTQAKLLRVLQDKIIRPIGSAKELAVDVRVLASSNIDIESAIQSNRLRADLYYRLNGMRISIPALRERPDDVAQLALFFLKQFGHLRSEGGIKMFSEGVLDVLMKYSWPGNVRELQNAIQTAILMSDSHHIKVADVAFLFERQVQHHDREVAPAFDELLPSTFSPIQEMERDLIIGTLKATGGNKLATATRLGMGRQTLYNKIKVYSIVPGLDY
jgi:transcriptional regulator with PAS, ATPase and Fis domain